MRSPDYDFLRRLRSLDQQLGGQGQPPPDVARVQVVSNSSYLGSRERAPVARHFGNIAASAVATEHSGFFISGSDLAGPAGRVAVNAINMNIQSTAGTVRAFLLPASTLTFISTTAVTPLVRDIDPEVTPLLTEFLIDAAALPSGAGVVPILPGNGFNANQGIPDPPMYLQFVAPDRVFGFINTTAQQTINYTVMWQAIRL